MHVGPAGFTTDPEAARAGVDKVMAFLNGCHLPKVGPTGVGGSGSRACQSLPQKQGFAGSYAHVGPAGFTTDPEAARAGADKVMAFLDSCHLHKVGSDHTEMLWLLSLSSLAKGAGCCWGHLSTMVLSPAGFPVDPEPSVTDDPPQLLARVSALLGAEVSRLMHMAEQLTSSGQS